MSQSHQLAAIAFADIAGYTAMMQHDEKLALEKLHLFKERLTNRVPELGGEIIQYYGDGCLMTFTNAVDAVTCAKQLQEDFTKDPKVPVRIGIHLGDILQEEGNIFGDSVNISSRIESMGVPGAVLLSNAIYLQIKNKPEFQVTSLGFFEFKNVDEPVEVFALSNDGFPVPKKGDLTGKIKNQPTGRSIAVLPFVNMSNDPEQEYFSDGMSEEIINSLTHVSELRVAGRTSSFYFKGKNFDLRKIGEKLNVQTILEGSVRKQGNKMRITAQLVNVEDGFHFWSEHYDREINDIFAIQDEIAVAITENLKITLLEKERALFNKIPTENKEAYDLYLKGRFYLNKRGKNILKALQYFREAVEKDPSFALAYAGMSDGYCLLALYSTIPAHQGMPKARDFAQKAIQSDPVLAEAYSALAFINLFYDWNWEEAKKNFGHVFNLNPDYTPAHYWYSYYLSFVECKFENSILEAEKAEIQEPLVAVSHHILSMLFINAGKYEEALKASKMAVELDRNFFSGFRSLGVSLAGLNRYGEAIEALQKAVLISSRHPLPLVELCWVYSLAGNLAEAQKIQSEFILRSSTEYISAMFLACVSYYSHNQDQAVEYLKQAYEQRDSQFPCIKAYPPFSFIREDPRFQSYISKMNFPEQELIHKGPAEYCS